MTSDPTGTVGLVERPSLSSKHQRAHGCDYRTKADCDRAQREALGKCSEQVAEDQQCSRWAVDIIGGRPLCEQHAGALVRREVEASRRERREAELNARIDVYIKRTKEHPSIWK